MSVATLRTAEETVVGEFTASNGLRLSLIEGGRLRVATPRGYEGWHKLNLDVSTVEALRQYFRAEGDERIGRWRWPEDPDYVAYPDGDDMVDVLYEPGGGASSWARRDVGESAPSPAQRAAVAYFEAHPEPNPWQDAKPGEVWLLMVDGEELAAVAMEDPHGTFGGVRFDTAPRGAFGRQATAITAGRCLWPEVAS